MKILIRILLCVATLWIANLSVYGDGCYLPDVAVKKLPDIPSQRALLRWQNGSETLVISSALDSESQRLGWIIPLPAIPTVMEKADQGGLKTLSFCLQPRITHDLSWTVIKYIFYVAVVIWLMAGFLFDRDNFLGKLLLLFLGYMVVGVLSAMLFSASMGGAGVAHSDIVTKTAQVGNYEVAVLQATGLEEINAWLKQNKFASLPITATTAVEEYVRQRWVFVAVKLTRDEAGLNAPHPIKLVFPAANPVYPMKLTALAGGNPLFELFVIGNQQAVEPLLKTEFCDRFTAQSLQRETNNVPYFSGTETRIEIGHPDIVPLLWHGCVVTKLSGHIASTAMTQDLALQWRNARPYQQHWFTRAGAQEVAVIVMALVAGIWIVASMIGYRERIRQPGGVWFYLARKVAPGLLAAALIGGITFAVLPKLKSTEVRTGRFLNRRYQQMIAGYQARQISEFFDKNPQMLKKTEKEISSALLDWLHEHRDKELDENVAIESTPGNITFHKTSDSSVAVTAYDSIGRPLTVEYR